MDLILGVILKYIHGFFFFKLLFIGPQELIHLKCIHNNITVPITLYTSASTHNTLARASKIYSYAYNNLFVITSQINFARYLSC